MTAEDAEELRSRAEPYIYGLPNETKARTVLEQYIAWMLSISNNAKLHIQQKSIICIHIFIFLFLIIFLAMKEIHLTMKLRNIEAKPHGRTMCYPSSSGK